MKEFNAAFEQPSGPAVYEPERLSLEQGFVAWMRANAVLDSAQGVQPVDVRELEQEEAAAWFMTFEQLMTDLPEWGRLRKSRRQLAEQTNRSFQCALRANVPVSWRDILPAYQLKWEFLVRAAELVIDFSTDDGAVEFHVDQLGDLFRTMLAGESPNGETNDSDRASSQPSNGQSVEPARAAAPAVRYEATDIAQ